MFKKFVYLASVSVLATTVMSQVTYAMDSESDNSRAIVVANSKSSDNPDHSKAIVVANPGSSAGPLIVSVPDNSNLFPVKPRVYDGILNDVVSVIDEFLSQPATAQPQPAQASTSTLWQAIQSTSNVVGNGLRKVGDLVRGKTAMGDLLASKGIETVKHYAPTGGATAAGIVEGVLADEGMLKSARLVTGNSLRWIGGGIKASAGNDWEKQTLERTLREFWLEKGFDKAPQNVLTDTACALYLSKQVNGVDDLTLKYRNFVNSWNNNSFTTHSLDPAVNQDYFVKGLIKALVQTEQLGDDAMLNSLLAFNVDLKTLPVTKDITEQTIKDTFKIKSTPLQADQVEKEVENAHKAKFLEYAKTVYALENQKYVANKGRLRVLANGNQPQPLAITGAAQPLALPGPSTSSQLLALPGPALTVVPTTTAPDLVTVTVTTTTATGTPATLSNLAQSMKLAHPASVEIVQEKEKEKNH